MLLESEMIPITKLNRDLKDAAVTLGRDEVRFLVNEYYIIQENRKRARNQVKQLEKAEKPHDLLSWFGDQFWGLERQIAIALDRYSASQELGVWAREQKGIGPIISAGLLAHIDLDRAPCASSIYRFAGLDPTMKWEKRTKRPWNADLKTLCWKIGQSFIKVSGSDDAFYGRLYVERKAYYAGKNDAGKYSQQAEAILNSPKKLNEIKDQWEKLEEDERVYMEIIGSKTAPKKQTVAYKHLKEGKLPPSQIVSRAARWTTKIFLAHYFEVGLKLQGKEPPKPWIIEHGGHVDWIPAPGF